MATGDDEGISVGSWMGPAAAEREIAFRVLERLCAAMAPREVSESEAEVLIDSVLSGKSHRGMGWSIDGIYSNGVCSDIHLWGSVPQSIRAVIERGIACNKIGQGGPIHQRRKKKLWWSPRPGEIGWADVLPYNTAGVWRIHVCHHYAKLSARVAYDLGLLEKPRWGDGFCRDDAHHHWPHRDKIEFSFLPKEFTPTMAKWLAELIFGAEEQWLSDNAQPFLHYRGSSYMWTFDADAAEERHRIARELARELGLESARRDL